MKRVYKWLKGLIFSYQCAAPNYKPHNVILYCQKRRGHFGKHEDIFGEEW